MYDAWQRKCGIQKKFSIFCPSKWEEECLFKNNIVLSEAARADLCHYFEAKTSAADYQRKPGRPLLSYAVSPSEGEDYHLSPPATISILLKQGSIQMKYTEDGRYAPWYRHSCLFVILVKLESVPQTERLEIAKELAKCGAEFYVGEKTKIELNPQFEWAWPFVQDYQDREGPSEAEWKACGIELDRL